MGITLTSNEVDWDATSDHTNCAKKYKSQLEYAIGDIVRFMDKGANMRDVIKRYRLTLTDDTYELAPTYHRTSSRGIAKNAQTKRRYRQT